MQNGFSGWAEKGGAAHLFRRLLSQGNPVMLNRAGHGEITHWEDEMSKNITRLSAEPADFPPAARRGIQVLSLLAISSACAAAGTLYVSDSSLFTVNVFNSTTGALTGMLTPTGGWGDPTGIAVGANGNVYVSDFENNLVDQFSASGGFLGAFINQGLNEPTGLAFGPDGDLYVANFGAGNESYINQYDSNGNLISTVVPSSTGLSNPEAIAFGSDGNLYIADSGNGAVDQVLLPSATFNTLIGSGCPGAPFSDPEGVAFGPNQNLFVSDAGAGCGGSAYGVYEYNTSGTLLETFIAGNILSGPMDLVFGPDGNLYVTDGEGRVAEFNGTTGVEVADFVPNGGSGGPLVDPTFLAFGGAEPAPEPAPFVSMGLGLAGLAWLLRRQSGFPRGL
jgi:DNA-binding beta-propeller fold protein YncE